MSHWTNEDRRFMSNALKLARRGEFSTDPNPNVGCVIVNHGEIVGSGYHARAGEAHAEVHALREAGKLSEGGTAYVTLEPCSHHGRTPPCADALIEAGVARVVCAMRDPNPLVAGRGMTLMQKAGIQVDCGLYESQATRLNEGFVSRMARGRPFVRLKMAMSLDGRTAMQSGDSQWITGADARRDVQRMRALASAMVTGFGTVQHDNPKLTVREPALLAQLPQQPHRVIIDLKAALTGTEAVFDSNAQVFLVVTAARDVRDQIKCMQHVEILEANLNEDGAVSLAPLMQVLAERQCNEVLVEAGAGLAGAFLSQGMVDELTVYMAAKLMGSAARPLANLPFDSMGQAVDLDPADVRFVGRDLRLQYRFPS